jgi:PPP family 3-phenylpropionic acid transporter
MYLIAYGAIGILFPYLAIYYRGLGLSGKEIGILAGVTPIVSLFAAPFWGAVADATQRQKALMIFAFGATPLVMLGVFFARSFTALFILAALLAFVNAPLMPILDNSTLKLLGPRRNEYGKLRVWGSIGFGITAPLAGILIERYGLPSAFYGYFFLMFCGFAIAWFFPKVQVQIGMPFWSGLRLFVMDRRWVLFLAMIFFAGAGMATILSFLLLYLSEMGANATLMGITMSIGVISEIAMMFYSNRLLARFGTRWLMAIGMFALVLRTLGFAFMNAPWQALVIQILQGIHFGAFWVASVEYANEIAPPGMGATAQGILSGFNMGLGMAVGAVAGGLVYDTLGPSTMYLIASISVFIMTVIFLIGTRPQKSDVTLPAHQS